MSLVMHKRQQITCISGKRGLVLLSKNMGRIPKDLASWHGPDLQADSLPKSAEYCQCKNRAPSIILLPSSFFHAASFFVECPVNRNQNRDRWDPCHLTMLTRSKKSLILMAAWVISQRRNYQRVLS